MRLFRLCLPGANGVRDIHSDEGPAISGATCATSPNAATATAMSGTCDAARPARSQPYLSERSKFVAAKSAWRPHDERVDGSGCA